MCRQLWNRMNHEKLANEIANYVKITIMISFKEIMVKILCSLLIMASEKNELYANSVYLSLHKIWIIYCYCCNKWTKFIFFPRLQSFSFIIKITNLLLFSLSSQCFGFCSRFACFIKRCIENCNTRTDQYISLSTV